MPNGIPLAGGGPFDEEPKNPDRVTNELAEYHNETLDEILPGAITPPN